MSEGKRSRKNSAYVTSEMCIARHTALATEIGRVKKDVEDVKRALIGEDLQSGLVKSVNDLKGKVDGLKRASLGGKEWTAIVTTAILAVASIAVALVK